MDQNLDDQQIKDNIAQRFKQLPKVVQNAITSADVQQHMRQLAEQHKLHFDQWASLENEVMFALLGFEPVENLADNIQHEVGVSVDEAQALAEDISRIVFAPIREELEKALPLETPAAVTQEGTTAAEHPLADVVPAVAPVAPGTPPPPPPIAKSVRAPISESYSAGQPSVERKIVEGDPYREPAI